MTAQCMCAPDGTLECGGKRKLLQMLLGQLTGFEYDYVLDNGAVSALPVLNSIIGLWLCKRMSLLLGSAHFSI